jgi:hypothetical protein
MHFNVINQGNTCFLCSSWDEIQGQNIWVKPFAYTLVLNSNVIKPFQKPTLINNIFLIFMSKWNYLNFILEGFPNLQQKILKL